jgi:hypothetical protein
MSDRMSDALLTVEDLAKLIHLSPATIKANLCRRPETLPPRVPGLSAPRWHPETYERWAKGELVQSQPRKRTGRPRNPVT